MYILFVCTGNICRSPLAEGIARHRYGDFATFASAGTMAVRGAPPTVSAAEAAAEIDIDIADLRSQSLPRAIDPPPDKIYVMTEHQRRQVAAAAPGLAGRIELLDPDGEVADPYGLDLDHYRHARDQISSAIERRAPHWLAGKMPA